MGVYKCKHICKHFLMEHHTGVRTVYLDDNKRCNKCNKYIKITKLHCPCCNSRLRTKNRNKVTSPYKGIRY